MFFRYALLAAPVAYLIAVVVLLLSGARSIGHLLRPLLWGLGIGFVGFAIGFWGPIYWSPEANQGPLLGIFFTGPAAALLGIIAGTIRSIYLARRGGGTDAPSA